MDYNRRILVTGSNSGLGLGILNECKSMGIKCFSHSRKNTESDINGDLLNEDVIYKISQFIIENDVNVLINNAGIYHGKELENTESKEIEDILFTNLLSPIILTKMTLEHFKNKGYGMIYNINSLAGLRGTKNESIYAASKHGLKGFTDSIIEEYSDFKNIRIVNVTLGAFKSRMTENRNNYNQLGDIHEISNCIVSHICTNYSTIKNDLIITRI